MLDDLFQVAPPGMGQVERLCNLAQSERMPVPGEAVEHVNLGEAIVLGRVSRSHRCWSYCKIQASQHVGQESAVENAPVLSLRGNFLAARVFE